MEESKVVNDQPDTTNNVDVAESQDEKQVNDAVSYDSYRKVVGKSKRVMDENEQLRSQLSDYKQRALESEGKKDELIEQLRKERDDFKSKYHGAVGSFAETKALDVITDEANRMGVTSTRLLKLAVQNKIKDLEFDEAFTPDRQQVQNLLAELREEEPDLFKKSAPQTPNHKINPDPTGKKPKSKKLSELKDEELVKFWEQKL